MQQFSVFPNVNRLEWNILAVAISRKFFSQPGIRVTGFLSLPLLEAVEFSRSDLFTFLQFLLLKFVVDMFNLVECPLFLPDY